MKTLITFLGLLAVNLALAQTIPVELSAPTDVQKEGLKLKAQLANLQLGTNVYTWATWAQTNHVADVEAYHQRKLDEYVREADAYNAALETKREDLATLRSLVPYLSAEEIAILRSNAVYMYQNP